MTTRILRVADSLGTFHVACAAAVATAFGALVGSVPYFGAMFEGASALCFGLDGALLGSCGLLLGLGVIASYELAMGGAPYVATTSRSGRIGAGQRELVQLQDNFRMGRAPSTTTSGWTAPTRRPWPTCSSASRARRRTRTIWPSSGTSSTTSRRVWARRGPRRAPRDGAGPGPHGGDSAAPRAGAVASRSLGCLAGAPEAGGAAPAGESRLAEVAEKCRRLVQQRGTVSRRSGGGLAGRCGSVSAGLWLAGASASERRNAGKTAVGNAARCTAGA
ncbi:unnamed protein product [Prorocentrum cordatum]|uniref:H(+)-exporting diphosphatase n=1 Tax=Prorocentrum cordatum TaxID=2364126 RepID=A0ABN9RHE7_9DINO|nr:unnamed protein product [Polarella glacialis]